MIAATRQRAVAAFTLVELMVGMAISAVILGGLSTSFIALQRSFEAANYQMTAQNDQLRILDYISRDLRMAASVTILNSGAKLSLTLPDGAGAGLNLNLGPLLTPLLASSPQTPPITCAYYVEGGQLLRDVSGGQTALAGTVAEVQFTRSGNFLVTDVIFTPRFSNSPTVADQQATRASSYTLLRNLSAGN